MDLQLTAFLNAKREHVSRLANEHGSAGEVEVLRQNPHFLPRPKGLELRCLLEALVKTGVAIRKSSFDAIAIPTDIESVDFLDCEALVRLLPKMVFVEIKTSNQKRVREDFSGFFFALTESEISAAELLGDRHRVLLFNRASGALALTSVPALLARARSTNWQVSIQL